MSRLWKQTVGDAVSEVPATVHRSPRHLAVELFPSWTRPNGERMFLIIREKDQFTGDQLLANVRPKDYMRTVREGNNRRLL